MAAEQPSNTRSSLSEKSSSFIAVWQKPQAIGGEMAQILIIYTTLRGKTGTMVEPVAAGIRAEAVEARIMQVEQVTMAAMTATDGIVVGSPTRFGAGERKGKLLLHAVR